MDKNKNSYLKKTLSIGLSIFTVMFVLFAFSMVASADVENNFEYEIVNDKAVVTAYNGAVSNITIPSTLGGKTVTEISVKDGCSFSANPISSANIPDSIEVIKDNSIGYQFTDGAYKKNDNFILFSSSTNTVAPNYGLNNGFKSFSNDLKDYIITLSSNSYVYTGVQKKPTVTLKYNGNALSSAYYTNEYTNNINVGTATATSVGRGALTGTSKSSTFKITSDKISNGKISLSVIRNVYTGKVVTPTVTVNYRNTKLVKDTDYTVVYTNNIKCGIAYAKITGIGNFTGTVSQKYYIYPGMVTKSYTSSTTCNSATIKWSKYPSGTGYKIFKYDSSSKKYKVCATINGMSNTSYTVKNLSGNSRYAFKVAPYLQADGCARVSSQGNKFYAYTAPSKVNLKYCTKHGTTLRIEWAKTGCEKYEVVYSTDKSFKKNVKTSVVGSNAYVRAIKNISKNKIYYAKVRAVRYVNGKKLSGPYSRVLNTNYSYCITSFSTNLNGSSSGRLTNVKLSTSAINGTILSPGETFSFDSVVGRRTPQRGYKKATVFNGSGVGTGYGGGVCQTSTTLFNAALRANLQIVERKQHSMKVSYINPGYDATINWGSDNLRFRNNTKYNIKIVGRVANGKITFSLYSCEKVTLPKVTTSCSYNNGTYTMRRYANGKCNYTTRSKY